MHLDRPHRTRVVAEVSGWCMAAPTAIPISMPVAVANQAARYTAATAAWPLPDMLWLWPTTTTYVPLLNPLTTKYPYTLGPQIVIRNQMLIQLCRINIIKHGQRIVNHQNRRVLRRMVIQRIVQRRNKTNCDSNMFNKYPPPWI